jgi:hypothetical protein
MTFIKENINDFLIFHVKNVKSGKNLVKNVLRFYYDILGFFDNKQLKNSLSGP